MERGHLYCHPRRLETRRGTKAEWAGREDSVVKREGSGDASLRMPQSARQHSARIIVLSQASESSCPNILTLFPCLLHHRSPAPCS